MNYISLKLLQQECSMCVGYHSPQKVPWLFFSSQNSVFEKPIYFLFVSTVIMFFADLSFYFLEQLFSVCLKYNLVLSDEGLCMLKNTCVRPLVIVFE